MNHSYVDCDVFVSIAKCKDHPTTGVTNVMKNLFGMLPPALYGMLAGQFADNDLPARARGIVHFGTRQPYDAPAEIDPSSPRHEGYRVPRAVADLNAARPVHLAIVDGVTTMAGAQTPDRFCTPVAPGWLVAGTNSVNTSAVGIAAMRYDPAADRGAAPFTTCDNKLRLAQQLGVGTCDLKRIEIRGTPVAEVAFDFMKLRLEREERMKDMASRRGLRR